MMLKVMLRKHKKIHKKMLKPLKLNLPKFLDQVLLLLSTSLLTFQLRFSMDKTNHQSFKPPLSIELIDQTLIFK